jgi:hypothetical protein
MPFRALRETLLKAGVAPRHVRRYLCELDDHLANLIEAQQAAGHGNSEARLRARALLGEDKELAAAMLAEPRFRSWTTRAPWLVFGLLPPLAIIAAFAAIIMPLVLVAHFDHMNGHTHVPAPGWFQSLAYAGSFLANLVLAPGLAALLVWMARRQRLHWIWPLLGITIITVLDAHMTAHFSAGRHADQIGLAITPLPLLTGQVSITHALTTNNIRQHDMPELPLVLAQSLLTLLPALMLLRRQGLFAREEKPD